MVTNIGVKYLAFHAFSNEFCKITACGVAGLRDKALKGEVPWSRLGW